MFGGGKSGVVLSRFAVASLLIALATPALASELVYQPVNPNFGGNSFNGAYLQALANAQNLHLPEEASRSPLEDFQRRVQSALLGRIASEITNQILGEDALNSGTFNIDSTTVFFEHIGGEVHIVITDGLGGSTEITIPEPTF